MAASIVLVDATDMKEYVIQLDVENANRAATDVTYALELLNAEKARQLLDKQDKKSASPKPQGIKTTLSAGPVTTSGKGGSNACQWSNSSTDMLLKEYKRLKPMFSSERGANKKCWYIISKALKSQGLQVSGDQCFSKFSYLKKTYQALKKDQERTGELKPWLFFKEMEELLAGLDPFNGQEYEDKEDELSDELMEFEEEEIATAGGEGEMFRWPHEAILLLMEKAMTLRPLCESGVMTQKQCWEKVAEALKCQGIDVSGRQCMTKFQCLRRTYKSLSEYNEKVGRGEGSARRRMDWAYYEIVGKLLKDSWTCTLNANGETHNKAVALEDSQKNSGSGGVKRLNGTAENQIKKMKTNDTTPTVKTNPSNKAEVVAVDLEMEDVASASLETVEGGAGTGTCSPDEEPIWCDDSTRLLLAEFQGRKNPYAPASWVYEAIAKSINKSGFTFSPSQVQTHWENIVNAYSNYGSGKPSPVRVGPYITELRNILKKINSPEKKALPASLASIRPQGKKVSLATLRSTLRQPGLVAKPPILRSAAAAFQAGVPTTGSTTIKTVPLPGSQSASGASASGLFVALPITNGETPGGPETPQSAPTSHGPSTKSRTKQEALGILHELKQELVKQNRELERQNRQREAFCQKVVEQNDVMIRQRERRNELLELLVQLRRT